MVFSVEGESSECSGPICSRLMRNFEGVMPLYCHNYTTITNTGIQTIHKDYQSPEEKQSET